jgi:hypothetical protein
MSGPAVQVELLRTSRAAPLAFDTAEGERLARIAARRAFVELKTSFMRAAADIDGAPGERLQRQVRQASEPVQLWRLRGAVLMALRERHGHATVHHLELRRQLDSIFADSSFAADSA